LRGNKGRGTQDLALTHGAIQSAFSLNDDGSNQKGPSHSGDEISKKNERRSMRFLSFIWGVSALHWMLGKNTGGSDLICGA
jgi:hypothetical protein